jgi:LPXTG-motif cell wall-anchored protein
MRQVRTVLIVALGVAIASLASGTLGAQTTSGTEVKKFEIVSVDGNRVVVRGEDGAAQEIVVPSDFRLTVDGQPVSVAQLKPGMRGTATITTTTTVTPVTITEVKKGKVLKVSGNTIIVRLEDGSNKMFTESEASKRGVKINRPDGRPMAFSEIREGYELSANIVTQKPPQVMTQREVDAAMKSLPTTAPAAPAARTASAAPAGAPPSAPAGAATSGKTLPKTASPLPLFSLVGSAAFVLAGLLRARRRRG